MLTESLIAMAASLLSGALYGALRSLVRKLRGIADPVPKPYSERLAELTGSLTKASSEVDAVLSELANVAKERGEAVRKLETDLTALEAKERDLKEKIQALENTPLPVAEHFARLLEGGERRSIRRDYMLFGAGVLVSTAIAIAIELLRK